MYLFSMYALGLREDHSDPSISTKSFLSLVWVPPPAKGHVAPRCDLSSILGHCVVRLYQQCSG